MFLHLLRQLVKRVRLWPVPGPASGRHPLFTPDTVKIDFAEAAVFEEAVQIGTEDPAVAGNRSVCDRNRCSAPPDNAREWAQSLVERRHSHVNLVAANGFAAFGSNLQAGFIKMCQRLVSLLFRQKECCGGKQI